MAFSISRLPSLLCVAIYALAPDAVHAQAPHQAADAMAPIKAQQVRPGLSVLSGQGGNVAAWTGPDGIVLVDDSLTPAESQLVEAVAKIAPGPIRFVVITHWHPDHAGGNEALGKAGAVLIAQDNARSRMGEAQHVEAYDLTVPPSPKAALPILTFADSLSLHLNGDHLQAIHVANAHTDGDAIVWWDKANAVHLGDLFYAGGYPFIDLGSGGSLAGVVAAIEQVLARADAKTVVIPGHGPVSGRAELAAYRDMLVAVGRRVRQLVEDGTSEQQILASHPTAEFDERYGKGAVDPDRFVKMLYADFSGGR
jgi:glyoxylase-like metal-dependent hydrolase (beta-lactamase superfamily II)